MLAVSALQGYVHDKALAPDPVQSSARALAQDGAAALLELAEASCSARQPAGRSSAHSQPRREPCPQVRCCSCTSALPAHGLHTPTASPALKRRLAVAGSVVDCAYQLAHQVDTAVLRRAQEALQVLARACDAAASGGGCAQPGQLLGASLQYPADHEACLLCATVAAGGRAPDLAAAEQAAEQGQQPAQDVVQRARLVANMAAMGLPVDREEALRAKGLLSVVDRLGAPEPLGKDASDSDSDSEDGDGAEPRGEGPAPAAGVPRPAAPSPLPAPFSAGPAPPPIPRVCTLSDPAQGLARSSALACSTSGEARADPRRPGLGSGSGPAGHQGDPELPLPVPRAAVGPGPRAAGSGDGALAACACASDPAPDPGRAPASPAPGVVQGATLPASPLATPAGLHAATATGAGSSSSRRDSFMEDVAAPPLPPGFMTEAEARAACRCADGCCLLRALRDPVQREALVAVYACAKALTHRHANAATLPEGVSAQEFALLGGRKPAADGERRTHHCAEFELLAREAVCQLTSVRGGRPGRLCQPAALALLGKSLNYWHYRSSRSGLSRCDEWQAQAPIGVDSDADPAAPCTACAVRGKPPPRCTIPPGVQYSTRKLGLAPDGDVMCCSGRARPGQGRRSAQRKRVTGVAKCCLAMRELVRKPGLARRLFGEYHMRHCQQGVSQSARRVVLAELCERGPWWPRARPGPGPAPRRRNPAPAPPQPQRSPSARRGPCRARPRPCPQPPQPP